MLLPLFQVGRLSSSTQHNAQFLVGSSKSTVTAGLIGGRVGNKGGVGISLKVADTTVLFLNAHLAGGLILYQTAND